MDAVEVALDALLLLEDALLELGRLFDDAGSEGVVLLVDAGVSELLDAGLFARGPHAVAFVEVVAGVLAHEQLAHFGDLRLEGALGVVLHLFLERLAEELFGLVFGLVELVQHVPALGRVVHELLLRDAFGVQLLEVELVSARTGLFLDLLRTEAPALLAALRRGQRARGWCRGASGGARLVCRLSVEPVYGAHGAYLILTTA